MESLNTFLEPFLAGRKDKKWSVSKRVFVPIFQPPNRERKIGGKNLQNDTTWKKWLGMLKWLKPHNENEAVFLGREVKAISCLFFSAYEGHF